MRKVQPAPAEGGQAEAADSVASVKDSANPEGGEAEEQEEEEDDAMVDAESELEAEADAGAVGSMEDSAVPEEGGAEEEAEERKGEVLLDAAAVAVGSVDDSVKPEGDSAVEEAAEEHRDDALVDDHVKTEDQGTESAETKDEIQGNEGGEMKYDTQGNEAAEMEVDKAGNGDGNTEAKVDSDNGSSPKGEGNNDGDTKKDVNGENQLVSAPAGVDGEGQNLSNKVSDNSFMFDYTLGGDDSGTEEEQAEFLKELERFHTEKLLEFKAPKFYGEGLNCLKLWRQVTGLGGYDQVTSNKLWRQVGESFKPPKTCTTVSWTFRNFYEKALIEYEKHKIETGEFHVAASTLTDRIVSDSQVGGSNAGSGRARRESATRAMQGWHSQRLLGNGEIADPVIKDKAAALSVPKKDKTPKSSGSAKRKRTPTLEDERVMPYKSEKLQNDSSVIDIGPPADWVKINVRRTKDCYEVYALVPGLLREEVHVQSDPAGRLIVTGEPEQLDNPWGVTPFKKVISLPSRIDPHQTSAVVTLHGQLFVRAPFEQSKS